MLSLVSSGKTHFRPTNEIQTTSADEPIVDADVKSEAFSNYQRGVIEEEKGNYQEALQYYKNAASHDNNPNAWYALGMLYSKGDAFEFDYPEKKITGIERELMIDNCYKKASEQGHPEASKAMGMRYAGRLCSWSTKPPFETPGNHALRFFWIAAKETTDPESSFNAMQKEFRQVRANLNINSGYCGYHPEEVENLKKTAAAGIPDAFYQLGRFQLFGALDMAKDEIEGIKNLTQAAKKGDVRAAYELGREFYRRAMNRSFWESSEKTADEEKAIELFKIALKITRKDGGYDSAYNIGKIYESRIGFFTNTEAKEQAVFYYLLASTGQNVAASCSHKKHLKNLK